MGFKMTIEVDVDVAPDAIGEYLRSAFFDEKMVPSPFVPDYRETGCYSTFDWREKEGVVPLPDLPHADPDVECWTRASLRLREFPIECRYYWDGDGILAFHLPDGRWLVNTDCKKDHGWSVVESEEEL